MNKEITNNWVLDEFSNTVLGDKRLTNRLVKLADRFVNTPERSINQACNSWAEVKAAYRFFKNDNVKEAKILETHITKTIERIKKHKTVLVVQDTSYITYTTHKKTSGLGVLSRKVGINVKMLESKGLIMHTAFAVSSDGLALGLLDQKIHSRPEISDEIKKLKQTSHNNAVNIEEKESVRWLNSLKGTFKATNMINTEIVTVCDREADMYDFFELAQMQGSSVLVRAARNREINRTKKRTTKDKQKLWEFIESLENSGRMAVEVPSRNNTAKRTAHLEVRFGKFMMNPSSNSIRHQTEKLQDLPLYAVQVIEKNPPSDIQPLERMLLTNIPVKSFNEAVEKVKWYCLRWKIEVFHKILKSGLKVEECRLGNGERLSKYLTVMSIIAWRIFFLTTIGRTNPNLPCNILLAEEEWQVLYVKIHKVVPPNNIIPTIKEVIIWVARLGGYLARNNDPYPGPIVIWRGWQRLFDLVQGWQMLNSIICG
jgi:hypothetical protein